MMIEFNFLMEWDPKLFGFEEGRWSDQWVTRDQSPCGSGSLRVIRRAAWGTGHCRRDAAEGKRAGSVLLKVSLFPVSRAKCPQPLYLPQRDNLGEH
jgi:hypothetical protein